ncbi:hypothetical protein NECID01_1208 [Nematocida sp. AWRm77]|nr:hypothetical protein NECID01_1208 [Nematocida sp. AWRm77]
MEDTEKSPCLSSKEKETQSMAHEDMEKWKEVVLKMKKSAHAAPFLFPVDPQRLNIPDYYDKIKTPMDLSTISKNLESGVYTSAESVKKDIDQMFSNCYVYNTPESAVYKTGQSLEKQYKQLLQKKAAGTKRKTEEETENKKNKAKGFTEEEMKRCTDTLADLGRPKHHRFTWPFLEPVDPVLVPTYYTLIKKPMDLSTMRTKLQEGQYAAQSEFVADFDLMINNCYAFNATGSEVYLCGTKLAAYFKQTFEQKKKKPADSAEERIAELKALISQHEQEIRKLEKKTNIEVPGFGYEEKKQLKRRLESFPPEKLNTIASFLQKNVSSAVVNEMEEIEVNLDQLDHSILIKLSDLVRDTYVEEQRIETDSSSE